ncbi:MAG: hypothetical protein ACREEY_06030 [Brevundimonas sp.]
MSTAALIAAASILLASSATAAKQGLTQAAPRSAAQAGPTIRDGVAYSRLTVTDGDQPAIEAGIWYPAETATAPRPLIVVSHGNGGDFRSHRDTVQALAKAGFVVATLTHTGDNWRDQSRATDVIGRNRQYRR